MSIFEIKGLSLGYTTPSFLSQPFGHCPGVPTGRQVKRVRGGINVCFDSCGYCLWSIVATNVVASVVALSSL